MELLQFSKARYCAIRERLLAEDPDLDARTLADTLEGLTDLHEVVAAIVRAAVIDEALSEGLRGRIAELEERLNGFEARAAKRRSIARDVMIDAAIKKITAPDFTISLRMGAPSLVVTDESAIPPPYWVQRAPRLDRQSVTADLKRGIAIPGAMLSNSEPVLSVRTK